MQRHRSALSTTSHGHLLRRLAITAGVLVLALASCSSPPPEKQEPPKVNGGLFLSVGGDANGLYLVDTITGKAVRIGEGKTGTTSDSPGLARSAQVDQLLGSSDTQLRSIATNGSGWTDVGGHAALAEGLAYDPFDEVLYSASNGYVQVRSPITGATIEELLSPPNQPDIEGLAFDFDTNTLYGLARGYEVQPEFRHELYAMDVEAAEPVWTTIGSTGGLWERAGLAFDQVDDVLYAVGRQGDLGSLFRIDPATGATTRVGSTGLADAAGGLAWLGSDN